MNQPLPHRQTLSRRPRRRRLAHAAAMCALTLASACGAHHALQAPPCFARYATGDSNRWVTADGVVMRAREVEEPPQATLAFWAEALQRHLERTGYRVEAPRLFRTTAGVEAARVDAIGHRGADDWLLITAIYPIGERLFVVEATGPWRQLQPLDAVVQQALTTFVPEGTGAR